MPANGSTPRVWEQARGGQLHQPRLADLVASALRNEILSGNLADGDLLPRQEDLLEAFGVSSPALREALRILETEGLVWIRRGNVGGAVVRAPSAEGVAYMVSLVLQSKGTPLADTVAALADMEPACAAMCARRRDRRRTIVPQLRALVDEQRGVTDNAVFNRVSRRFHEAIVSSCGNATMVVIVGALEAVWSSHEHRVYEVHAGPDHEGRLSALRVHEKLIDAIEAGDEVTTAALARHHLEAIQGYTMDLATETDIVAELVRSGPQRAR